MMTFVSPENSTTPVRVYLRVSEAKPKKLNPTGEEFSLPAVIIDCFAMLSDTQIKTFFAAGYEVKGLDRGHMKRLKEEVAEK